MNKLKNIKTIRTKNPNPKLKLLLGEEHTLTSSIESLGLKNAGFEVKQASSINEILTIIEQEKFDIVMIDLLFQKGLGVKNIIHAKKISLNPKIRFVVCSVINSQDYKEEILNCNADLFLTKPMPRFKMIEELKKVTKTEFRKSQRTKCLIPFKIKKENNYYETYISDISADGLHVLDQNNNINPFLGMELEFEFILPKSEEILKAKGSVVRFTDEGFGVKFSTYTQNTRAKIEEFVLTNSLEMKSSHYYL